MSGNRETVSFNKRDGTNVSFPRSTHIKPNAPASKGPSNTQKKTGGRRV